MQSVKVSKLVKKFELELLTDGIAYTNRLIHESDVNRPALQLAGFFAYFDPTRLQVIGKVENTYLEQMSEADRTYSIQTLFSYTDIPCVVICREEMEPLPELLKCAIESKIPIFKAKYTTSEFLAEVITWLINHTHTHTYTHSQPHTKFLLAQQNTHTKSLKD